MDSIKVTRRQFLKWLTASAAALGLSQTDLLRVEQALAAGPGPTPDPLNPLGPTGLGINGGTLGRVIWLAGAACSGCPTSLLNYIADTADPDPVLNTIANNAIPGYPLVDLNAVYPGQDGADIDIAEVVLEIVTIDYAQVVMAASGDLPNLWMKQLRDAGGYVLMTEGALQTAQNGLFCRVLDMPDPGGTSIPAGPWDPYITRYVDGVLGNRVEMTFAGATLWLAQNAAAVLCLGTCASYGGIPGAKGSVTQVKSTYDWVNNVHGMNKLIANIPGCPPHPDWFVATAGAALLELNGVIPGILTNNLNTNLDHLGRPKNVYTGIYHTDDSYVFCEDCPRRDTKPGPVQPAGKVQTSLEACRRKSGQTDGQCMENNGCVGYLAGPKFVRSDCPTRKWNTHTNWPVGNNYPCNGCTDPGFPDKNSPFFKRTKNA